MAKKKTAKRAKTANRSKARNRAEDVSLPNDYTVDDEGMIVVETPEIRKLKVRLGGEVYAVSPLKGSIGINLARRAQGKNGEPDMARFAKFVEEVVIAIFTSEDAKAILKRLRDPEDGLDLGHIMSLMSALMDKTTTNPTM